MEMKAPKKRKGSKRKVLLRDMTDGECYRVASHSGSLFLFSYGRGKGKTVSIYGDPKGLKFLASLLNDVANVDQTLIPDINCPKGIGTHYHIYKQDGHVHPKSNDLLIGRLDGKGTGSHDWFIPLMEK